MHRYFKGPLMIFIRPGIQNKLVLFTNDWLIISKFKTFCEITCSEEVIEYVAYIRKG